MRASDVRNGLRVRVRANNAGGGKPNDQGSLLVRGDTIVIDRLGQGNRAIYKIGDNNENYMNLEDLELIEPRVKNALNIDVWEASRGYIR